MESSWEVELPRNPETVTDPAELLAEPVVVEWHHHLTAFRKLFERLNQFGFAVAIDEDGHRRREGKCMLDRTVDTDQMVPAQNEIRSLDGAFRTRFAGAVPFNLPDFRATEQGDIELHRLLGVPIEHQVCCNCACHSWFLSFHCFWPGLQPGVSRRHSEGKTEQRACASHSPNAFRHAYSPPPADVKRAQAAGPTISAVSLHRDPAPYYSP